MTHSFVPIHQHLLMKAIVRVPLTDPEIAKQFLTGLVKEIGMEPVTMPQAVYVNDLGNEGLTGSINLATSHIAFHMWDATGVLMADVYSCKHFDNKVVLDYFSNNFGPLANVELIQIDRATGQISSIKYL